MAPYDYRSLDIRDLHGERNSQLQGHNVLGVEVTIPALASYCNLGNIDHHGPEDTAASPSASEQAMTAPLPPPGSILVTVCADADSLTAMAILANRMMGDAVDEQLVTLVANDDKLGPSVGKPSDTLIAVSRVASDSKKTMTERVNWIRRALSGIVDPEEVRSHVQNHLRDFNEALSASKVTLHFDNRVATVVSKHRYATRIGYMHANVLVCLNHEYPVDFKDSKSGTYKKFTLCRYNQHVAFDLPSALSVLLNLEPGWGGRADIIGSPIGLSSKLSLKEVLDIVGQHLK